MILRLYLTNATNDSSVFPGAQAPAWVPPIPEAPASDRPK